MSGAGITDEDRERIAAFTDSDRPDADALLPDGESVRSNPGDRGFDDGSKTAALADRLREHLAVGEEFVGTSAQIPIQWSTASIGRSMRILAGNDVRGLDVESDGTERDRVRWRVRRTDTRGEWR